MNRLDVRKAALEGVQARASGKNGSERMKGKVGIITGVGPELGIGVGAISPYTVWPLTSDKAATAKLFAREGKWTPSCPKAGISQVTIRRGPHLLGRFRR